MNGYFMGSFTWKQLCTEAKIDRNNALHTMLINGLLYMATAVYWSENRSKHCTTYHPSTRPWLTNHVSLRFDITVFWRFSRLYSYKWGSRSPAQQSYQAANGQRCENFFQNHEHCLSQNRLAFQTIH